MTSSARPPLPPIPAGFGLPFYYGSLTNIGVNYLVDPGLVQPFLAGTGLVAALMRPDAHESRRYACVSYNYQLYFAQFSTGTGVTQEIELNIVVYPDGADRYAPDVTFAQFIAGDEQTKLYGNHRVHVACDSDVAIDAGRTLFGEPKFKASFVVSMPSPNGDPDIAWDISCNAPAAADGTPGPMLWSFHADLGDMSPVPASVAPISEYGTRDGRMLVAPWNILAPFSNYVFGPGDAARVTVAYGQEMPGLPPMAQDLRTMIDNTPAASAFVVQSPPVAMQNRPYYVGPYGSDVERAGMLDAAGSLSTVG